MRHALIIAACCLSLAAQAQKTAAETRTPTESGSFTKSPGEAPKAPVISDADKAAFQKARADYDEAQMQAKAADDAAKAFQETLNAKIRGLQEACGPLWQAQLDKDKNPFCAAKPAEAAKK